MPKGPGPTTKAGDSTRASCTGYRYLHGRWHTADTLQNPLRSQPPESHQAQRNAALLVSLQVTCVWELQSSLLPLSQNVACY